MGRDFPHGGLIAVCQSGGVARVLWSVREGNAGVLDGRELMSDYRSTHPTHEPRLGEVLYLPDGSGPWRVVDWLLADRTESSGNVLVVELLGD